MGLFGRRKSASTSRKGEIPDTAQELGKTGPWSPEEAPDSDRIDMGSLSVPAIAGLELMPEPSPDGSLIISVTVVTSGSATQLMAIAQPRSGGLWEEIRAELVESLSADGGDVREVPGQWGTEIKAEVPTELPDGRQGITPLRVIGISGDRWLLRVVIRGQGAVEEDHEVTAVLEDLVVRRGSEPRAPRDVLTLQLPQIRSEDDE